jgi:hypothetical protein
LPFFERRFKIKSKVLSVIAAVDTFCKDRRLHLKKSPEGRKMV